MNHPHVLVQSDGVVWHRGHRDKEYGTMPQVMHDLLHLDGIAFSLTLLTLPAEC